MQKPETQSVGGICTFPSDFRHAYPHPTVDVIIKNIWQRVLLVKRNEDEVEGGKWALPGGYVEKDQGVPDAARAEVAQETGWRIGKLTLFMILDGPRQNNPNPIVSHVFTAPALEKIMEVQTGEPDDEIQAVDWFDLAYLPSEANMAFDHRMVLAYYRDYLRWPHPLPQFLSQAPPLSPEDIWYNNR